MTIEVLSNDDVRNLPVGRYTVTRGNATVQVFEVERHTGKGKTSKRIVVLLEFPCTLRAASEEESDE